MKPYPKQTLTLAGSQICTVSSQNIDFPPLFTPTTYTERLFSAAASGKINLSGPHLGITISSNYKMYRILGTTCLFLSSACSSPKQKAEDTSV